MSSSENSAEALDRIVFSSHVDALAEGGCVAPRAEGDALLRASSEGVGPNEELIARRLRGEPLAWITGSVRFCGVRIRVGPRGVRAQAAEAAARRLRPGGRVLLELGGDQADEVATTLADVGLTESRVHRDGDGQDCAIEARRP